MKGKSILLLGIIFGASIFSVLFQFYGDDTWKLWNIPTMNPYMADLRVITGCSESYALGYDPLEHNPGDPWGRQLNYPRIWQLVCAAGIDQSLTVYIGALFIFLFFVGIFLYLPDAIHNVTAYALLLTVWSPAVMLGIERGNNDLVIFFLLSLTIYLVNRNSLVSYRAGLCSALLAFILKIYPVFSLFLLLRKRERIAKTVIFSLMFIILYLALNFKDLPLIHQNTGKSYFLSYGLKVIPMWTGKHYGATASTFVSALAYSAVIVCIGMVIYGLRSKVPGAARYDQKSVDAFRIGSGIYIGTFFLGTNWDYRLMFLLFTVPQLMVFTKYGIKHVSLVAKALIAALLASTWYLIICMLTNYSAAGFFIDEFSNWALFFGLAYLLAYSAPDWVKKPVHGMSRSPETTIV